MKRLSRAALAIVTTAAVSASAFAPASAQAATVELNILGVTDFHGHIAQDLAKGEMGAAGLACYVESERATNPNTSFITVGDNIGGSPFVSSILKDAPTLAALSAIGVDASALGNHEFDQGYADLAGRVSLDGTGLAQFPYLGANVEGGTPTPAASEVVEMGGVRVAYVGSVTDETSTLVSPAGIPGITFTNDLNAVNAEADRIMAAGEADVVIALMHSPAQATDAFSTNVDVVFAGHTHEERVETGPARDGKQPLVVIQGMEYGKYVSDVEISYDSTAKKITAIEAVNVDATTASGACGVPNALVTSVAGIVDAAKIASDVEGAKVVATIENSFFRGADSAGATGTNRGVESSLNNLIAEAGLQAINAQTPLNADIGVMNAGGVRADLEAGEVTFSEAFATQNFSNTYGVVDITGADFIEALEQQWKDPAADRPRLALGLSNNVQYSYNPNAAQGERITHVTINDTPIDETKTYRIAGSTFLLSGGDGFTAFSNGTGITDSGLVDIDLFNSYLATNASVDVRANQASVGIELSGAALADDSSLIPGEKLTVDLSALSYTGGEVTPTTVTVTLGAETVTVPVDNTIVPKLDTTGTATATLIVPAGVTELKIETDAGTTFTLPVVATSKPADGSSVGSSAGSLVAILGVLGALGGLLGVFLHSPQGAPFLTQLHAFINQSKA
ncbi:5'-nucleotidase [Corynebacterium deserti GIMN1.010]|uniref:5'-nucleotidase n=1 Tax=Corynebacterium deserti GIMN1.010 TaxID=931089 RepID=A0A0M3Q8Z6_9CORY|nr:bifunctional UDP-sugar hydrolase/5'-nucleotidase [Corynebacterium deserti]ALC04809.1 5'-nucleotidase [Corynebacterium deserti GIMN1.010]